MNQQAGRRIAPIAWLLGLVLLALGSAYAAPLDIDGDGTVDAATDGQLILRHLFGFTGTTLTAGVLSDGATRDQDRIQGYLSGLGASLDADGNGTRDALTDGLLILRHLSGRTGTALTDGALAADATRDATAIAAWIDRVPAPAGEAPSRIELVAANSLSPDSIQLDWLPTFDNDTPGSQIAYVLHAGPTPGYVPDASTARFEVLDDATGIMTGLSPTTVYYVKVEARDSFGNRSWSNELESVTADVAPDPTAAPRAVLDAANAPDQLAEPDRIDYRLGVGATPPATGDILVSAEGDGFLRRAATVSQNGDRVSVQTQPAALNEAFQNLALSAEIKLIDLPAAQANARARSAGRGVLVQRSRGTTRATWPASGLTLIEERPVSTQPLSTAPSPRASTAPVNCANTQTTYRSVWDWPLKVSVPDNFCREPKQAATVDIWAEIEPEERGNYMVTQLFFEGLYHQEVKDSGTPNYGAIWTPPTGDYSAWGQGKVAWTPYHYHVDRKFRPYTARFTALAKEREDHCSGGWGLYCKEKKVSVDVDIGVTWGDLPEPKQQGFKSSTSTSLTIDGEANVDFRPEIQTQCNISWGGLDYGKVAVKGPIALRTRAHLLATAAAEASGFQNIFSKFFIKVFWAGSVPVVMSGRIKLDLEFRGNVDAALDLEQILDLGYEIEAGVEYRNGSWSQVKKATPWQRYEISGEANAHAYVELRFVPAIEISFYDVATGRLQVEPYLYGEAAVEGHFLYRYLADNGEVQQGTDADYRFTKLELGGGIDVKLRAGLEVFDRSILGYPSNNANELYAFPLIERTPFIGLPGLDPGQVDGINPADSRAIALKAAIHNVPNPFYPGLSKEQTLNPFAQGSGNWQVILPVGGERFLPGATTQDTWFGYTAPGQYRLRFGGHSKLGSFIRQYEEMTLDLPDSDGDGMTDHWETRWGVDDPTGDPDKDGLTSLQEFRGGTNPKVADSDSDRDGLPDAWERLHGLDPNNPNDAADNADHDWLTNLQEMRLGTDPQLAETQVSATQDGPQTRFSWTPRPTGDSYTLYLATEPFDALSLDAFATKRDHRVLTGVSSPQTIAFTHGLDVFAMLVGVGHGTPATYSPTVSVPTIGVAQNLRTTAASGKVTLSWDPVPNATGYRVYVSTASPIDPEGAATRVIDNASSPAVVDGLTNGQAYYFAVRVNRNAVWGAVSQSVSETPRAGAPGSAFLLNDTGIVRCANFSSNSVNCPVSGYAEQDAEFGRDVTNNDGSDGHAGFSFTKLDASGNPLAASATAWSCVRDNVTGLIWEVKTDDGGLRDKDWTYSWYNPDAATNGGSAGTADGGNNCFNTTRCDTQKYVADVNVQGLCGAHDWRLPDPRELLSIVSNDRVNPAIDTTYFPNTVASWVWSASPFAYYPYPSWSVDFSSGNFGNYGKSYAGSVRLVRGGQ